MKVIITVKGGAVTGIYTDNPGHVRAEIVDLDVNDEQNENDVAQRMAEIDDDLAHDRLRQIN